MRTQEKKGHNFQPNRAMKGFSYLTNRYDRHIPTAPMTCLAIDSVFELLWNMKLLNTKYVYDTHKLSVIIYLLGENYALLNFILIFIPTHLFCKEFSSKYRIKISTTSVKYVCLVWFGLVWFGL